MKVVRVIRSELRRLFSNKTALLCIGLVFAAIIILITAFLLTNNSSSGYELDFEREIERYEMWYKEYQAWYLYYIGEGPMPDMFSSLLSGGGLKVAKEQMEYYKFFLDTRTTAGDYFDLTYSSYFRADFGPSLSSEYNGGLHMFTLMHMSFIPLLLLAFITAILNCVSPYYNGVMKNYYASPVGRRAVMSGKLIVTALLIVAVWLVVVIWGLILGAFGKPAAALYYSGSHYYSVPQSAAFIILMLGTLVGMLTVASLTVFMSQWLNNSLLTAASTAGCIAFFVLIYEIIAAACNMTLVRKNILLSYMPVFGLHCNELSVYDFQRWIIYGINVAISAVLITVSIVRQNAEGKYIKLSANKDGENGKISLKRRKNA